MSTPSVSASHLTSTLRSAHCLPFLTRPLRSLSQVEQTYPDTRFDFGSGSQVYTAKMMVFCLYKGPRGAVPLHLNVSEAGQ